MLIRFTTTTAAAVAARRSIILIPALLLVILPLLLFPLLIPLLGFKFLLPQFTCFILVQIWEDQVEDLAVPFDGVAGDAFFDVLFSN